MLVKIRKATIKRMLAEVDSLVCPPHITSEDLESINERIDNGQMTDYQFKLAIKLLVVKPPQTAKFISVEWVDYTTMDVWRSHSANSHFVEVRIDENGDYLNRINWSEIERTSEEVLRLMGIRNV